MAWPSVEVLGPLVYALTHLNGNEEESRGVRGGSKEVLKPLRLHVPCRLPVEDSEKAFHPPRIRHEGGIPVPALLNRFLEQGVR